MLAFRRSQIGTILLLWFLTFSLNAAPRPDSRPRLIARIPSGHQASLLVFSQDGKTLASTGLDSTIKLWNIADRTNETTLRCAGERVHEIVFSPDSKNIISNSYDNAASVMQLWDIPTHKSKMLFPGRTQIECMTISADGDRLAFSTVPRVMGTLDIKSTKETVIRRLDHRVSIFSLAFSRDGKVLALCHGRRRPEYVGVCDIATGAMVRYGIEGRPSPIVQIFSPDCTKAASTFQNDTLHLWDTASGEPVATIERPEEFPCSASFRPDGKVLAVSYKVKKNRWEGKEDTCFIRFFDSGTGEEVASFKPDRVVIGRPTFSPDGKQLAITDKDGDICLWDVHGVDASRK